MTRYILTFLLATGASGVLAMEEKVAVVPGSAFGGSGEGFIRISFATSVEKILEGIKRIKRFLSNRI